MNIKEYLEKNSLMAPGESFIQYTGPEHNPKEKFSFSSMSVDMLDLRDHSERISTILKDRWFRTEKLLVISTSETKSTGLDRILQNTLSLSPVPAGPGLFLFFKDRDLEETYYFNIQLSAVKETTDDVLTYLALARIRNESVLSSMPVVLKETVKKHLGNNIRAIAESRKLIAAMAQPGIVKKACEETAFGFQDDEAIWIHTSLIGKLDPVLRVYIGCSSFFFGNPALADIVKIHKNSSKITYYLYDDFENKHLPEMHDRIKVDLSRQKADHFDHRNHRKPEVVYFKERFISPDDSRYNLWKDFSRHLESRGISPEGIHTEQNNRLREVLDSFCA